MTKETLTNQDLTRDFSVVFQPLLLFPGIAAVADEKSDFAITQLCTPGTPAGLQAALERNEKLNKADASLMSFSQNFKVLERIGFSLRAAKVSYILGNYLGTIAMCGFVGEMVAILVFKAWYHFQRSANTATESRMAGLTKFYENIEKKRQQDRVDYLLTNCIIEEHEKQAYESIRGIRNRYLHRWSETHENIIQDAEDTYQAAITVTSRITGARETATTIRFHPLVMRFLDESAGE